MAHAIKFHPGIALLEQYAEGTLSGDVALAVAAHIDSEQALEKLGFITEEDITNVRASALGVPYMDLKGYLIDAEVIKLVPEALARKHNAVPLFKIGEGR